VTDAYIDGLGVSRKGLPVVEYLVFGALDRLHAGGEATRACDYAAATARAVVRSADAVIAAWEPDRDDFRGELIDAGIGSTTYSQLSEPLNDAANAIFIAIERVEGIKLAKPLGKRDGGIAQPDAVESRFSDNSIADLLDSLDGAQAAYESTRDGVTGASFRTLIAGIDATLDADVRARFDQCRADVSAIAPPLRTAVETSPGEVEVAFSCTKELLRLFKVDIAGALGVTTTFGDVDGD